jgi:dienelactone hydrolase
MWHHGFRADALAHAGDLERCAADGFLAIGVDAVGHGARRDPLLADRIAQAGGDALPVMVALVEQTVVELPKLIDAIAATYPIDRACLSMVGISMGAFLAYRAVAAGIPVRAIAALFGSPEWDGDTSPHLSPGAFSRVALLSVTAEYDVSVPAEPVERLHASLGAGTVVHPHHHYILRGAGHLTTADEWLRAMRVTRQWLVRRGR